MWWWWVEWWNKAYFVLTSCMYWYKDITWSYHDYNMTGNVSDLKTPDPPYQINCWLFKGCLEVGRHILPTVLTVSTSNTWIIKMPSCKTTGKEYVIKDAKDAKFMQFAGQIAKEVFDKRYHKIETIKFRSYTRLSQIHRWQDPVLWRALCLCRNDRGHG